MKYVFYVIVFFFLIASSQSCSKKRVEKVFESGLNIPVLFNPDKFAPIDSFISKITVIPLETNDKCLIGKHIFSVKQHQDLLYINSDLQRLLVFDMNGKYIRDIGSRGQGPGEFIEVRDFIFTSEGTIELLDFKKIEAYTLEGKHIETKKRFDFLGKDFYLNPQNFCRSLSSGYYFWGGRMPNVQLQEKSHLLYRVNDDMQIDGGAYFSSAKYGGGTQDRFKHYQDYILITPSRFDYNIYQINANDSLSIRYSFDFGKFGFDKSKEVEIETIPYENYISTMCNFHETERLLHYNFSYNNRFYSFLYSKTTKQYYIQTFVPYGEDMRFYPIKAIHNEQLISIFSVDAIKFDMERMSEANIKKWGLEECHNLDEIDNPVIVIYTHKL